MFGCEGELKSAACLVIIMQDPEGIAMIRL